MYRPSLRPGEELVRTSPGVNVKNVHFDAFLTSKRIIFVKKTDSLQERKELVFPLNLVKDFQPSSDESGTPSIRFSIEKPSGEVGDLILKLVQTGDYRYAERDDWIEDLKSLSRGVVPRHGSRGQDLFLGGMSPDITPPVQESRKPDADLFSTGPKNPYAQSNPGFTQPPVSPSGERYSASRDFHEPTAQKTPPEERFPMQQGFSQPPAAPPSFSSGLNAGETKPVFCRFCGTKVPSGSAFCPSCGGKLEQQPEMRQQPPVSQAPSQRPPVNNQPFSPPPPPIVQQGGRDRGFVSPPPPSSPQGSYGQQPGYPPRDGGISLADDRSYGSGFGSQISPKSPKSMMKEQAKADKARMKEQARAEKDHAKAMKGQQKAMKKAQKGGGYGYDNPYGSKESRMPEPKIIIAIVAVIAIIAIVGFAFSSGMIGGSSGTTSAGNSGSSSSSGTTSSSSTGTTSTSETYGNWYFAVYYPGEWSGTYTVNGATSTITDSSGESEIYGTQPSIQLGTFSGTVEITANILDDGAGGTLSVYLYNAKGVEVDSAEASGGGSATIFYG